STAWPLALSDSSRRDGKAAFAGRPKPAVSESPSATILTGVSAAAFAAKPPNAAARTRAWTKAWTGAAHPPYDRGRTRPGPIIARRRRIHRMNDTWKRADAPAIALTGVNLSLGRGAARVHILKDIDLNIGHGEAIGMVGPSGSGKSTLLMVMAGLERP